METVLAVEDLKTYFFTRRGTVKAVDGVSFTLGRGETIGLVGESGCGKTMTSLSIMRLLPEPPARIVGGRIMFEGENLIDKSKGEMQRIRGKKITMILQDPLTSLNPVLTLGNQLAEPLVIHQKMRGATLRERCKELLRQVEIPSPDIRLAAFPHQLSGGMRQRAVGAIAISCSPALLIADEPTTSLDATIQAQYLDLLKALQQQTQIGMIFITHDFGIVAKICDKVGVMYAGKIVEEAKVDELFYNPLHPYTQALIRSVPKAEEKVSRLESIGGQPPPLYDLPAGCSFAARCAVAEERCQVRPPSSLWTSAHHSVSCWRYS